MTSCASGTAPITLKKTVRTFKKEVGSKHHMYPALYRTGDNLEPGDAIRLGPTEQVLYDHKVQQAQEILDHAGTFVLVEELVYTLHDASLALLHRFIQVVPKPASPKDLELIADVERHLGIQTS